MSKKTLRPGFNPFAFIPSMIMLFTMPFWLYAVYDFLDSFLPNSPTWRVIELTFIGLMTVFVEHAVAEVFGGTLPPIAKVRRDFRRRYQLKYVLVILLFGVVGVFALQMDRVKSIIDTMSPLLMAVFGPYPVNYLAKDPGILLVILAVVVFLVYQRNCELDAKKDIQDELDKAAAQWDSVERLGPSRPQPAKGTGILTVVFLFGVLAAVLGWLVYFAK